MGGIVFFRTKMLKKLVEFYVNRVGMRVWLEQADCTILQHGGLLVGFCQRELTETEGMLTFFYATMEEVDNMFAALREISTTQPCVNEKYGIYQFLATDPEGRIIEFQNFMHPVEYTF